MVRFPLPHPVLLALRVIAALTGFLNHLVAEASKLDSGRKRGHVAPFRLSVSSLHTYTIA